MIHRIAEGVGWIVIVAALELAVVYASGCCIR